MGWGSVAAEGGGGREYAALRSFGGRKDGLDRRPAQYFQNLRVTNRLKVSPINRILFSKISPSMTSNSLYQTFFWS